MKLHSNVLTEGDLYAAARDARNKDGADIYVTDSVERGSRKAARSIEFHCHSEHGKRATNSGNRGHDGRTQRAATWEDWGYLIARLYLVDADASMTYYADRDDFVRQVETTGHRNGERGFLSLLGYRRIQSVRRATSSVNGNPAFHVTFTDGVEARTMSDSGCAYEIGNPDMREGSLVTVEFTKTGRIRTMSPAVRNV